MAEYINREKMLSKVKNNYIEDAKNGYDYYDYLLKDDLMAESPADVIERSKIDKAIEEIMDIDWHKIIWKYDDVEIGFKSEVEEILKRNIGEG